MSSVDPVSQQGVLSYSPTIGDGTNNFVLNPATTQGYYCVQGNIVSFQATLSWTSKGSAVGASNVVVSLPVPCLSAGQTLPPFICSAYASLEAGANTIVMGHMQLGTRFANLDYFNTSTQAQGFVTVTMMPSFSSLSMQGWYFKNPGALGLAS